MPDQILRSPILNPRADGSVEFLRDGVIHVDAANRIAFIGNWSDLSACLNPSVLVFNTPPESSSPHSSTITFTSPSTPSVAISWTASPPIPPKVASSPV